MAISVKYSDDVGLSWEATNPTGLGANEAGWLNFNTTNNRWYLWDGTQWLLTHLTKTELESEIDISVSSGSSKVPRAGVGGTLSLSWIQAHTDHGIFVTDYSSTVPSWRGPANYPCMPMFKDSTANLSYPKFSDGSSFPTSPVDGQRCMRTDMSGGMCFYYESASSAWLSESLFSFAFSGLTDFTTSIFLMYGENGTSASHLFTSTYGMILDFDCIVVGMQLAMNASGSCGIQVYDDGSAVTGATLSLSSQQAKCDTTLRSNTIAANSIMGVKRTSGTVEGPHNGRVWLRRIET